MTIQEEKELASYVIRRFDQMNEEKSNWTNLFDEVLELYLPRKSFVFDKTTQGQKKTRVVSSVGIQANEVHANALHSFLTNPTVQFFEYYTGDPQIDTDIEVKKFLDMRTELAHSVLNESNFHTEVHENYLDLGVLGTDVLRMEDDKDQIIRFEARPIYDYVIAENPYGVVDQVGREKLFTGDNIVRKYGTDWIEKFYADSPGMAQDFIQKLLKDTRQKFKIIEFIQPKEIYKNHKIKIINRPFVMATVFAEKNMLIKQNGYNEELYAVSRLTKSSHEVYGRSHAMKTLPDMLSLNELQRVVIQGAQMNSKPPVVLTDDGGYPGFRMHPGAVNYRRPGADAPIAFNPNSRHDIGVDMLERLTTAVKNGFNNDKLELPNFQRATTLEVQAKRDEDLRSLSPMLARQHNEKLVPLVRRLDALCERAGIFKDLKIPKLLENKSIGIKYSSQIARVQKTVLAENANKWLASIQNAAQMNPEMIDNIDFDAFVKYQAFSLSAPSYLLRTEGDVQALRKQRADQQADQMEREAALQDSQTAKQSADALQKIS